MGMNITAQRGFSRESKPKVPALSGRVEWQREWQRKWQVPRARGVVWSGDGLVWHGVGFGWPKQSKIMQPSSLPRFLESSRG